MEKVRRIYISEVAGDLVVQLDGGGAQVRIVPGMRADVAVLKLRELADMLEFGLVDRSPPAPVHLDDGMVAQYLSPVNPTFGCVLEASGFAKSRVVSPSSAAFVDKIPPYEAGLRESLGSAPAGAVISVNFWCERGPTLFAAAPPGLLWVYSGDSKWTLL